MKCFPYISEAIGANKEMTVRSSSVARAQGRRVKRVKINMMTRFKDVFTYVPKEPIKRVKKASIVVPGQTVSLAKMVERMRAGLPVSIRNSGFNPDGFPVMDDLTSLDEFRKTLQRKVENVKERIKTIKEKNEQ